MGRIGEYTQQVFLERSNPSNIEASGGVFMNKAKQSQLDSQMYQELGADAAKWGNEVQRQRDVQGELNAREKFNEFQRQKIGYQQDLQNQRMTSPDGFSKEFDDWHRINASEIEDSVLSNGGSQPFDRNLFRQLMDNDRTSTLDQNTNWENGMRVRNITTGLEKNLDEMNVNYSLTNPTIKDLSTQLKKQREYVTTTAANILSPEEQHKIFGYASDKAALTTMNSELQNNPKKLRNVILYGGGSQDQLIDLTFDIEGRDKIAKEPNGSIAKYGINGKANGLTDDQVRNLTPEAARAIYKKKYWDPRLDKMDPAMRAVAFDAVVNHGNDKDTWGMIQAAKGDPYTLISIRQQYYKSLIEGDPEKYGEYKNGWDHRLNELADYAQAQDDGGRDFLQNATLVNPDVLARVQSQIPDAMAAKERADALQKQARNKEFDNATKSAMDDLTDGKEPLSEDRLDEIEQMAVNSGDENNIAHANALRAQNATITKYRTYNEVQMDAEINDLSKLVKKEDTPENRARLEIAQKVKDSTIKGIKDEGLAYYSRMGVITPINALDFQNPANVMAELQMREKSAGTVQSMNGKAISIVTPTELQALSEIVKTGDPRFATMMLSTFQELSDDTQSYIGMAAKDNPILGALIGQDDADVSTKIIRGARIEGAYSAKEMKSSIVSKLAEFNIDPGAMDQMVPAIEAYYKADAFDNKNDITDTAVDSDRVEAAIENVIGPSVDLGRGFFDGQSNRIFSMRDPETGDYISENDMYDMFNGIDDKTLKRLFPKGVVDRDGKEITSDHLDDFNFISVGSGSYMMVSKDKSEFIPVSQENVLDPLIIDGKQLLSIYKETNKVKKYKPPAKVAMTGLPMG